jgi:hypothetical protein
MRRVQFEQEKNYRVSVAIAKAMLTKKLITEKEYRKIDSRLIAKYNPVIGGL